MKRLNPKTQKFFIHGDIREDGYIFTEYMSQIDSEGYFVLSFREPIRYHIKNALCGARSRAKKENLSFNLDSEYLMSIKTDNCPVFNFKLSWGVYGEKFSKMDNSPSLDRVVPELGYVKGNVVFLSNLANTIKQNVTEIELYAVADWLHEKRKEVFNAKENTVTPLPAGDYQQGEIYPELGPISLPGVGQDDDNTDHHCGTIHWEDIDHRAQASSGDSLGRGGQEVGTPSKPARIKDHGLSGAKVVWIADRGGYIPHKP